MARGENWRFVRINADADNVYQIYFAQIKGYPLLGPEEELALARLIQNGSKEALHTLIHSNLRLVIKIAHGYTGHGIAFMDIIQEGNVGLLYAAEKFDPCKKYRFCTFATWWIRHYIERYLASKRHMVKLSLRKEMVLRKIQYAVHSLSQTLNRQPGPHDIAVELGIPIREVVSILNIGSGYVPLELDADKEEVSPAIEYLGDNTYNPEHRFLHQCGHEEVQRFLGRLKERERLVLSYRFRLEEGMPHTLKEISEKLNVSSETVRVIEKQALAKIRRYAAEMKRNGLLEAVNF